jgi:broad specificity phosphatase PhoE
MNDIILMRHGQTEANKNFIVQGRMDNPLNEDGIRQAFRTGVYFSENDISFDLVISSPLKRAYTTAKEVNKGMLINRPIVLDKGLIERNFGDYDGKEINDDYYYLIKRGLVANMETNEELEERVCNAITDICKKYPDKRLLVVTHSHVIKAVLTKLVDGFTYRSTLHNCSLNHIVFDGSELRVKYYNFNPLN